MLIPLSCAGLLLVCAVFLFFGLQGTGQRALKHLCVAAAFFPICTLVSLMLQVIAQTLHDSMLEFADTIPGLHLLRYANPLSGVGQVTLLDVELMVLLFLVVYGTTVILHRMVDIVRLLKVARRMKDYRHE